MIDKHIWRTVFELYSLRFLNHEVFTNVCNYMKDEIMKDERM